MPETSTTQPELATARPGSRTAPGAQWALIVWFLLLISIVPLVQLGVELARDEPVQELDVFRQKPTLEVLQSYERALEDNSIVGQAVRKRWSWASFKLLRAGNQKVVAGRDGTLFYRAGIDGSVYPGVMDAARDVPGGSYADGHPVTAIAAFNESLRAHGVKLVVLVVPGKQTIYPEELSRRYRPSAGPAVNTAMPDFLAQMRRHQVCVVDPTDVLWRARADTRLYLRLDTHWTPEGMALVAEELVKHVREIPAGSRRLGIEKQLVTRHGDLYDMLGLAPGLPPVLPDETVIVQRVIDIDTGVAVEPDPASPVTLLGDSFANIYSVEWMGWGDHGGLGEHLALRLGMAVDIIALNDGGVNTARANLVRRPRALEGKQIVIWQFAARDLVVSNGQWQRIDIQPERR
jgi:alginate O-acetyltransferase complex protein AlgJ